jgi:hypothetical protein
MSPLPLSILLRSLAGVLAATAIGSVIVPAQAQVQQTRQQQQADANRHRCTNGVVVGGAAGGLLTRGSFLNRLGGAAIGATAGCVINRGVNEGK